MATETYCVYIDQLIAKVESDWEILGGHKAFCNEIMNTLPTDRKLRVFHWFSCGGPNLDWDYKIFIQHFNDSFEDKTSA